MGRRKVEDGMTFGRWTVTATTEVRGRYRFWLCICECGASKYVNSSNLMNGTSKSCGCLKIEKCREIAKTNKIYNPGTHRMSKTPEFRIWSGIRNRCLNSKDRAYHHYGGRGITICSEWSKFETFYKDMGPRPAGMEIDRIDNNKGYSKENCRWSTREDQMNNIRRNNNVTLGGVTYSLKKWARIIGIDKRTLNVWVKSGRSEDDILGKKYKYNRDY